MLKWGTIKPGSYQMKTLYKRDCMKEISSKTDTLKTSALKGAYQY